MSVAKSGKNVIRPGAILIDVVPLTFLASLVIDPFPLNLRPIPPNRILVSPTPNLFLFKTSESAWTPSKNILPNGAKSNTYLI